MKLLAITLLAFLSATTFQSCKKEKLGPPKLEGLWIGKYANNSTSYPSLGYAFLFRKDGTVRVFNNSDTSASSVGKAEGTYTISGSNIKATYTYFIGSGTYSSDATVDGQFNFMEGTWGNGSNATNGGKFFVYKTTW